MASEQAETVPEKFTLRLAPGARMALEWMANKQGLTLGEVIRQAISTQKFLIEEMDRGGTVIIEEKSGRIKQLVLI